MVEANEPHSLQNFQIKMIFQKNFENFWLLQNQMLDLRYIIKLFLKDKVLSILMECVSLIVPITRFTEDQLENKICLSLANEAQI